MKKKIPNQKRLTPLFYSICMLSLIANVSWGQQIPALQQVIGSFPIMDGGFEAQPLGASYQPLNTITVNASNWTISTTPASTTRSVIANASEARSGSNYVAFSNAGSTRLQSPIAPLLGGTQYTVQYFYKSTLSPVSLSLTGAIYNTGGVNAALTPTPASAWVTNTWTKGSATFTSGTATGSNYFASPRMGNGTADNSTILNVDDFVVYAGALDEIAPLAPSPAAVSGLAVSWTAPIGGVDGGGYLVVRYATSPNVDNAPNQNGIYAVSNTITKGTGSLRGTVVYIGTATSFTDAVAGSSSGNDFYKIYAVDKAFNYSSEGGTLKTNQWSETNPISIYPNPVKDNQFTISLPSSISGKVVVGIYNISGQLVYKADATGASNSIVIRPTQSLKVGVYVVKVENDGKTNTQKITVR
jgi:hypothetical protein